MDLYVKMDMICSIYRGKIGGKVPPPHHKEIIQPHEGESLTPMNNPAILETFTWQILGVSLVDPRLDQKIRFSNSDLNLDYNVTILPEANS